MIGAICRDSPEGQSPVRPAQLALVIILQAHTGASDDEAVEALTMDRPWQSVLDCQDCERAPLGSRPQSPRPALPPLSSRRRDYWTDAP